MYAVVGCTDCGELWLLSDPETAKTAQCPRCRTRHRTRKLRRFFESEDREAARQARTALLAERRDELDALETLGTVSEMDRDVDAAAVPDREFLEASGLDADEVEAAGDVSRTRSRTRLELVRDALREQDRPTAEEVVAYAEERGVAGGDVRDLLEKLTERGDVTKHRGRYRLL